MNFYLGWMALQTVEQVASSNNKDIIHVLHVDDDLTILETSNLILMDMGNFEIDHACCVDEAFKRLATGKYDVVISDYEMPQKDGLQFLKELREQSNEIPFILFTGKGREEIAIKALNLGSDAYINKQGNPETVYGELSHFIVKTIERKNTKKLLAESESKYLRLFNTSEVGMFRTKLHSSEILDINDKLLQILGYTREEMQNTPATLYYADAAQRQECVKILQAKGQLVDFEIKLVNKQGKIKTCLLSSKLYPQQETLEGSIIDITERKKAEQALIESEEKFRTLAEESPNMIFINQRSRVVYANKKCKDITAYSREDLYSPNFFLSLNAPEFDDPLRLSLAKHARGEEVSPYEYALITRDGKRINAIINTKLIEYKGDRAILGIVTDITERKKIENELRQETEKLETITESIGAGLTVIGKDYHILWTNKVMKQIRGLTDLKGRKCYGTYNHLDTLCPECGVKKVFDGKESHSREFMIFDEEKGTTVWVQLVATPIKDKDGNVTAALELVLPITERKMMEQSLESSEERFRAMMNSALDAIIAIDDAANIVAWNQAASRVFGYRQEEIIGKPISTLIPFNLTQTATQEIRRFVESKPKESFGSIIETVGIKKDGTEFPAELSFSQMHINGKNHGVGFVKDITERKKAETSIRSSEEKFRNLAEQSPNIIFINQKGKIVYANTEAEEVTGYTKEEFYSSKFHFMDLIAPDSKEFVESKFIKHMKGEDIPPYEYKLISKNGKTKDVINSTKVIDYNGEPAILGVETDVTESKRLKEKLERYSLHLEDLVKKRTVQLELAQAQLVKSERLATIGELAGMVGHDLRNPLEGIKNAAYFLKKKGATLSEAQQKQMFEIIENAINHSDKIINDLLDYSREIHMELTERETSALLNEAILMVQVPERIQIVDNVLDGTWVKVDAHKMMRVFINLIKNAIDAMPEKGRLEITSRQTGGKVEIAFADTGTGISEEVLPKIFSPLFTTKAQGMGFGLAICKRIMEAHGGTITVKTAVNKGTTFIITLPIKPKVEVGDEKTLINMPESLLSTTTKA